MAREFDTPDYLDLPSSPKTPLVAWATTHSVAEQDPAAWSESLNHYLLPVQVEMRRTFTSDGLIIATACLAGLASKLRIFQLLPESPEEMLRQNSSNMFLLLAMGYDIGNITGIYQPAGEISNTFSVLGLIPDNKNYPGGKILRKIFYGTMEAGVILSMLKNNPSFNVDRVYNLLSEDISDPILVYPDPTPVDIKHRELFPTGSKSPLLNIYFDNRFAENDPRLWSRAVFQEAQRTEYKLQEKLEPPVWKSLFGSLVGLFDSADITYSGISPQTEANILRTFFLVGYELADASAYKRYLPHALYNARRFNLLKSPEQVTRAYQSMAQIKEFTASLFYAGLFVRQFDKAQSPGNDFPWEDLP